MNYRTIIIASTIFVISGHTQLLANLASLFFSKENFHEVIPGALYRSAQLKSNVLEEKIKRLGIKTIINLRGKNPWAQWWWDERRIAAKYDVAMVDIPLSAIRLPSKEQLRILISTIRSGRVPMLIHCAHGSDRTGAGCALAMREFAEQYSSYAPYNRHIAERVGKQQLVGKKYGHWTWFYPVMDTFVQIWFDLRRAHATPEQALEAYQPHTYGHPVS